MAYFRKKGKPPRKRLTTRSKASTCTLCEKVISRRPCSSSLRSVTRRNEAYVLWKEYVDSAKHCSNCYIIKTLFQKSREKIQIPSDPYSRLQITSELDDTVIIQFNPNPHCNDKHSSASIELVCLHEECCGMNYVPVGDKINPQRILGWIETCDNHHPCAEDITQTRPVLKRPPFMMLIDLELNCLVRTSAHLKYTCLSYVWGHTGAFFKTTKKNLNQLFQPGVLIRYAANIPRTIRDAMLVTKGLGIRFLWVDRLCIIQDDDDMLHEQIKWIASIYACSYFTIVAASGSDGQAGLRRVAHPGEPHRFHLNLNGFAKFTLQHYSWDKEEDIYNSRAWTFQERLLSSRCLVFYRNTVKWECGEGTFHEFFDLSPQTDSIIAKGSFRPKPKAEARKFDELVRDYSMRNLTFEKDAMKAFAAILCYLEPAFPGGFYFGLPEGAFHIALQWREWVSRRLVRRNEFPSWSWLGWKGQPTILPFAMNIILGEEYDTRYFRPPIPLVEWYKQERDTRNMVPIRNFLSHWQSFEQGSKSSSFSDLSSVAQASEPEDLRKWSPVIHGRVKIGKLKLGDLLWSYHSRSHLLDMNDRWCGTVQPTDSNGSIYHTGELCEILPISRGNYTLKGLERLLRWHHDEVQRNLKYLLRNLGDEDTWYSIIHALCIRWESGIAYRDGLCYIWAETWDQIKKQEVDIMLG